MVRQGCHFGEWLQGRLGPGGPVVLVTLLPQALAGGPDPRPVVTARLAAAPRLAWAARGQGALPPLRLHLLLAALGLPAPPARLLLHLPFAPGLGTGMSTASLLAAARLLAPGLPPRALAEACLAAEGASDPLMHPRPDRLLWASRQGRALAPLPPPPRAHLLAGFFGPALPTRPGDSAYADVSDLIEAWSRAPGLAPCADLASESARRCLARRGPAGDPTEALARDLGALGWAASHSGAARALIFAPGTIPPGAGDAARAAGLRGLRRFATGGA